ncbi:microtubule associated protein-domain-containing protein [Infundibulicybe gibba]|nr:microtubule associated protein-domain-containing protein [Infundibulicybe gibba]
MKCPPILTLPTLLTSLHTHLQTQTAPLPSLHVSLGLPPSALADDLQTLHDALVDCAVKCVAARRGEADDWLRRCEEAEGEVRLYTRSLGGYVPASIKVDCLEAPESVLPRRLEKAVAGKEKLKQLYHTKLEQLTTLTTRLQALTETLGEDSFFARDVVEPPPADPSAQDPDAIRDVTPERFMRLEKELVRGKAEIAKRLSELSELFTQIEWLYAELGIAPASHDDCPSTSAAISSQFLSSTSSNDPFLTSTPTPLSLSPKPTLLAWAAAQLTSLEATKTAREARIQAVYDELEGLWRRLGIDDADIDAFVEQNRGSTGDAVKAYEEELERMLEVKRERMGEFVAGARVEIENLWEAVMCGEEERALFAPFWEDVYTEELLKVHEDEIHRLKEENYLEICDEEKELAAAASDQTRLLGRGARDPGRLLREEKMRKRVSREKPRLEQDLFATIPHWERETGRAFLVYGDRFIDILRDRLGVPAEKEKENKAVRGGSAPPIPRASRSTTPGYAPGPRAGTVRPASAAPNGAPPTKKQRLGESGIASGTRIGSITREPLGARNGTASPTKYALGRSTSGGRRTPGESGLPKRSETVVPPMPTIKPTGQYEGLGYGRPPPTSASRGASAGTYTKYARPGQSATLPPAKATKAPPPRRESFKPRPSVDLADIGLGASALGTRKWGAFGGSVREEVEE